MTSKLRAYLEVRLLHGLRVILGHSIPYTFAPSLSSTTRPITSAVLANQKMVQNNGQMQIQILILVRFIQRGSKTPLATHATRKMNFHTQSLSSTLLIGFALIQLT